MNNIDYVELYEKQKQKDIRNTFSRFMLGLVALTGVAYIVIFIAQSLLISIIGSEATLDLLDNVFIEWLFGVGPMYIFGLPSLILITMGMKTKSRESKKLSVKDFFAILLICQGVSFVGSLIGTSVTSTIGKFLGKDISVSSTDLIERSPLWLIILVAVIIGPIIEEFIFRKLLIDRISRFGDVAAILTSGIAFGIFHNNFEQLFYATMLGMIFAFVYVKTGKLLHTTLLHIVVNFLGSIVVLPVINASERLVAVSEMIASGANVNMSGYVRDTLLVLSYSAVQYAAVFAGLFILFRAIFKKKIQVINNSQIYISRGLLVQNALFNVGTVLFLVVSFVLFAAGIILA